MTQPPILSSETIHASCVAIDGRGLIISGTSGSGKSDLALRLIDRGAKLVSDDYTVVRRRDGRLFGSPPATIAGKMEVRGIGIVEVDHLPEAPICLAIELLGDPRRMPPEGELFHLLGIGLPAIGLSALEASAPIKVELALARLEGLRR